MSDRDVDRVTKSPPEPNWVPKIKMEVIGLDFELLKLLNEQKNGVINFDDVLGPPNSN